MHIKGVQMKLYMIVTPDKYELPVAVFDSPRRASDWLGYTNYNSIYRAINKPRITHKGYRVERIVI